MDQTLLPPDSTNDSTSILSAPVSDTSTSNASGDDEASPTRAKKILKTVGWLSLGTFCLLFFTLLKLPEDRIRGYVQGMIAQQLASQGITMTAAQSSISIGFGISYTMKDITLSFQPPQEPVHIEQISVHPSLLSMLTGKLGASLEVENKGGTLEAKFSTPLSGPNGPISLTFHATHLDLGSLGVLSSGVGIKGSAIVDGEGHVDGDTSLPTSLDGKLEANLSKVVIDQQSVMGFSVPRLSVSEGKADVTIDKGKAVIKTLQIGKPSNAADDIHANITGDVTLGRNLAYSTLNLKANFSLSQNILKAFVLLDAILGSAKQADGSYSYTITGPLNSPNPVPVAGAGGAPSAPSAATPPAAAPQGASSMAHPGGAAAVPHVPTSPGFGSPNATQH